MKLNREVDLLLEVLNLSESELGNNIGVKYETINNWKNNRTKIDDSNLEKIYSYAYSKNIRFNLIYEQLLKEEHNLDNKCVLFHGAKTRFSLPIDINQHSKTKNDFGVGFYLGETFEQAANYISYLKENRIYAFLLDLKDLKICKFDVNNEWMLAISYYRGWLDDYKDNKLIMDIIKKCEDADVIIAPIADNRMFDIISEFVENTITDLQCQHALAATNLGYQYVLKTEESVKNISFLQEMYLCQKEKDYCTQNRIDLTTNGLQKVKMARIEYKQKGNYIEELLK